MLAYVHGTLVAQTAGSVIVELNGMALKLLTPTSLNERLPAMGEQVKLHTHLHWREDGPQLFGFGETAEVELFLRLIAVSGIGPKVALAILSYAPPARILAWLIHEDFSQLRKIPGVGLKTAQRLVLELKEKAASMSPGTNLGGSSTVGGAKDSPAMQALEALMSLGYESYQASQVLAEVQLAHPQANLEMLIFEGLKRLAR